MKTALIVVDLQNEFLNGKMKLPHLDNIVKKINEIQHKFDIVCFTKNITQQEKNVEIKKDNIKISDSGHFCIEGTDGSELIKELNINDNIFIRNYDENLSISNSKNIENKNLIDFLKENGVTHTFLCGSNSDYTIRYSQIDLLKDFKSYILIDLLKTIYLLDKFVNYLVQNKLPFTNTLLLDKMLKGINTPVGKMENKYNKKTKS